MPTLMSLIRALASLMTKLKTVILRLSLRLLWVKLSNQDLQLKLVLLTTKMQLILKESTEEATQNLRKLKRIGHRSRCRPSTFSKNVTSLIQSFKPREAGFARRRRQSLSSLLLISRWTARKSKVSQSIPTHPSMRKTTRKSAWLPLKVKVRYQTQSKMKPMKMRMKLTILWRWIIRSCLECFQVIGNFSSLIDKWRWAKMLSTGYQMLKMQCESLSKSIWRTLSYALLVSRLKSGSVITLSKFAYLSFTLSSPKRSMILCQTLILMLLRYKTLSQGPFSMSRKLLLVKIILYSKKHCKLPKVARLAPEANSLWTPKNRKRKQILIMKRASVMDRVLQINHLTRKSLSDTKTSSSSQTKCRMNHLLMKEKLMLISLMRLSVKMLKLSTILTRPISICDNRRIVWHQRLFRLKLKQ